MVYILQRFHNALKRGQDRPSWHKAKRDRSITVQQIVDIWREQMYRCAECDVQINRKPFIDHIHPIAKGGAHTIENLQLLCHSCNSRKYDKLDFVWSPVPDRVYDFTWQSCISLDDDEITFSPIL